MKLNKFNSICLFICLSSIFIPSNCVADDSLDGQFQELNDRIQETWSNIENYNAKIHIVQNIGDASQLDMRADAVFFGKKMRAEFNVIAAEGAYQYKATNVDDGKIFWSIYYTPKGNPFWIIKQKSGAGSIWKHFQNPWGTWMSDLYFPPFMGKLIVDRYKPILIANKNIEGRDFIVLRMCMQDKEQSWFRADYGMTIKYTIPKEIIFYFDARTYLPDKIECKSLVDDSKIAEMTYEWIKSDVRPDKKIFSYTPPAGAVVYDFAGINEQEQKYEKEKIEKADKFTGKPCPEFSERDLNKNLYSFNKLKGQVLVLVFWRPVDEYSELMVGAMDLLNKRFPKGSGVKILTITRGDKNRIREFMESNKYSVPLIYDSDESMMRSQFWIPTIPRTFFIDKKGIVREVYLGYSDGIVNDFEAKIKFLRAEE